MKRLTCWLFIIGLALFGLAMIQHFKKQYRAAVERQERTRVLNWTKKQNAETGNPYVRYEDGTTGADYLTEETDLEEPSECGP